MRISSYDSTDVINVLLKNLDSIAGRGGREGSLSGRAVQQITAEELKRIQEQAVREFGLGAGAIGRSYRKYYLAAGVVALALVITGLVMMKGGTGTDNWTFGFIILAGGGLIALGTLAHVGTFWSSGKCELDQLTNVAAWALRQTGDAGQPLSRNLRGWFSQYIASYS